MQKKQLLKIKTINRLYRKALSIHDAAIILGYSERHISRLLHDYKNKGPSGIISKKLGVASNRSYKAEFKNRVIWLLQNKYLNYGPTASAHALNEYHNINISTETVRRWMIGNNIWPINKNDDRPHP